MNNIEELKKAALKATQGEWWLDVVETKGTYGVGDDCSEGFHSYAVYGPDCRSLLDMTNSTAAIIHTEEDGDYLMAWDETGRRNAEYIALANPAAILDLIAQLEAAQKEIADWRSIAEAAAQDDADWHKLADKDGELICKMANAIIAAGERAKKAEAALSAANEKLNKVITDDWNEIGPTYPAHYTPVIVAMNGVTQHITYQIEEGDNGDYWQPVSNEDADGAPMTQFQHWKPLPAGFTVEGE
ncbi:ead/Ea22-like family protein [Yersinia massiliensis]|uniref:ead/Ea22-like family protein n=1 Tax=Yersinia massiliensis TaxID=419257 RepID=UPI00223EDDEE|nr:ead/Ea22-like family protein [Yersinia massiliensis]MDA5547677.1 ead/Ea22-like family protein [Yersinia massiliensis]UZM78077.1 ead/Ea22-like family protein [Yersinia massiliensis]